MARQGSWNSSAKKQPADTAATQFPRTTAAPVKADRPCTRARVYVLPHRVGRIAPPSRPEVEQIASAPRGRKRPMNFSTERCVARERLKTRARRFPEGFEREHRVEKNRPVVGFRNQSASLGATSFQILLDALLREEAGGIKLLASSERDIRDWH